MRLNKRFVSVIITILSINVFTQGNGILKCSIVTGAVTDTSARFWACFQQAGAFFIEISPTKSFSSSIQTNSVTVTALTNFAGIVQAQALQADKRYYYRPVFNGVVADTAERLFTTFPVPGTRSNLTFAFGSCQQSGNFLTGGTNSGNVFRMIRTKNPQLFLQLGDWTYPDTTDNTPFDQNYFANSYQLIQKSYEAKFSSAYPMDSLLRVCPIDYLFDDHDFVNDNASATTISFGVPYRPNFLGSDFIAMEIPINPEARLNSIRGYLENVPTYPVENSTRGIYHSFNYGNCEFFLLDLRSQRSPNLEGLEKNTVTGKWEFNPPSGHTILGRDGSPGTGTTQLTWLLNKLKYSTADWKFIVSSVPFNKAQKQAISLGIALQDSILPVPAGVLPEGSTGIFAVMDMADKWAGFSADIDTLLAVIRSEGIKNCIVLSGDSHTAAMDDGTNAGLPEIMAGGLDITNSKTVALFEAFGLHIWNKGGQGITTQNFYNAFGLVSVYGKDSVALQLIDEQGSLFAEHTVFSGISGNSRTDKVLLQSVSLEQNYPNPFNGETIITFSNTRQELLTIDVFDCIGSSVATLHNKTTQPGVHQVRFNTHRLSSGVYFYQLRAGEHLLTRKMIVIH